MQLLLRGCLYGKEDGAILHGMVSIKSYLYKSCVVFMWSRDVFHSVPVRRDRSWNRQDFFNCYLANFGLLLRGGSLTHPILITAFLQFWPKGHWEPRNEVLFLSRSSTYLGLNCEPSNSNCNGLTHFATFTKDPGKGRTKVSIKCFVSGWFWNSAIIWLKVASECAKK